MLVICSYYTKFKNKIKPILIAVENEEKVSGKHQINKTQNLSFIEQATNNNCLKILKIMD